MVHKCSYGSFTIAMSALEYVQQIPAQTPHSTHICSSNSLCSVWASTIPFIRTSYQSFLTILQTIPHRPYFWNSQSLLSSGQTCRVLSQREMQWKWKAWLQIPQATVHSSFTAEAWFAWHSIHRSMIWLRQIAQLSTTMSHAHRATAFHFLTSNRFFPSPFSAADPFAPLPAIFFAGTEPEAAAGASFISTSAIMVDCGRR